MREITVNAISVLTGIERRTVAKRLAAVPALRVIGRSKQFDSAVAFAVVYDEKDNTHKEKARLDRLRADAVEEQLKRSAGQLIHVDDLTAAWTRIATEIKTRLLAIPTKAAPLVVGLGRMPRIRKVLETLIHGAIDGLVETGGVFPGGPKATAAPKRRRVGGSRKAAKSRGKRGTRKVEK